MPGHGVTARNRRPINIDNVAANPQEREQVLDMHTCDGLAVLKNIVQISLERVTGPRVQQPNRAQIVGEGRRHRPPAPAPAYPARGYTHRNPTVGIDQRRQDLAGVEGKWKHPKAALRTTVLVQSFSRQHHAPALIEQDDGKMFWLACCPKKRDGAFRWGAFHYAQARRPTGVAGSVPGAPPKRKKRA